jgi:hypothetical protein
MAGVYSGYGFQEYVVNMAAPAPAEESARYWQTFIDSHIPNFDQSPIDQIDRHHDAPQSLAAGRTGGEPRFHLDQCHHAPTPA